MNKYDVQAEWTGGYPTLCFGEWNIVVNGIRLTGIASENFNTEGTYSSWHFEDWSEVFEDYEDGLPFDEWVKSDINGLHDSLDLHGFNSDDMGLMALLYEAISAEDWRSNSCGGCI